MINKEELMRKYIIPQESIERFNDMALRSKYKFTDDEFLIKSIPNTQYKDELMDTILIEEVMRKYRTGNMTYIANDPSVRSIISGLQIYEYILSTKDEEITTDTIKDLHILLTQHFEEENAGKFRTFTLIASDDGEDYTIQHENIEEDLDTLVGYANYVTEFNKEVMSKEQRLETALLIKNNLMKVSPFEKGNDQVSKILFQIMLYKLELPLCTFDGLDIRDYEKAINIGVKEDDTSIIKSMYLEEVMEQDEEDVIHLSWK